MKALIEKIKLNPVWFLVVASLATRLLLVLAFDLKTSILDVNFAAVSAGEQAEMARGLLNSGDFTYYVVDGKPTPSAYQPPLYPTFLAGLFSVAGDGKAAFVIVQLIECAAGLVTVLLTYNLARRFLNPGYALLAGTLAAFWPPLMYMPNEAHPISFLIPTLVWITLLTVDIVRDGPSLKRFALLGLAFAIGAMMRSEMVVGMLATLFGLAWSLRKTGQGKLVASGALVCLAITGGVQASWMLRNKNALGKPVLTTTAGVNLFRGDGPTATGGSYQWDRKTIVWETPETLAEKAKLGWSKDYELRLDDVYMQALKRSLKDDPLRPLKLAPMKFLLYWTSDFTHPKGSRPEAWFAWMVCLPATVFGFFAFWRRRKETWPLLFWTLFYMVVVMIFFALPRYRLNVEPIFLVMTAAGIQAFRERGTRSTAGL